MTRHLATIILSALAMSAAAQTADDSLSVNLHDVVVTATRTPRTIADAPVITRVVAEDDIKKMDVSNITEVLTTMLPGLEFSYAMNQQTSLNFQGFSGTSVLFLVDGERMAGETMDNIDYSRLNLDNVRRIEIVRGAASALYGSNAVGGVINIITKENRQPWALSVSSKIAAHGDWQNRLSWSLKRGKWNNTLNIHHTRIDNYGVPSGDFSTVYGGYSWNIKDQLRYQLSDNVKLTGRYGYFFRQRNFTDANKYRYRDFDGALRMNAKLAETTDLEVAYHYDQYDKSDFYPLKSKDIRDYSNIQNTVRALLNHSFNDDMTLTTGLDLMSDYLMSYQFEGNGNHTQYTGDLFAQFDWNITPRFNLLAGLRGDAFSEVGAHVSPRISLKYKLLPELSLRGGYANGFRVPTQKERFMNFDMAGIFMIYGNNDLKPENSHNLNLSAEWLRRRMSFTLSGYYNFVSNRITTVWSKALQGMQYLNTEKVDISGLDATFDYRFPFGLNAKLSYAYTHEGNTSSYVMTSRPHSATATFDYGHRFGNYSFNILLNGRWLSKLDTNVLTSTSLYQETEAATYPAYTIWRLVFTQHWKDAIHLAFTIDNLFNYVPDYYYNNSPTTTGTTCALSLSLDIDKLF